MRVTRLVVPVENGMLVVGDPALGDPAAAAEALDAATSSGRFVAVVRDVLVVVTPAEDSEGTPVTVEVAGRPPGPAGEADHVVDVDLRVADGRLEVGTPAGAVGEVTGVPLGRHRVRVAGRGFTPFDEYDGVSRESYHLTLWPAERPGPPVVIRPWPGWAAY